MKQVSSCYRLYSRYKQPFPYQPNVQYVYFLSSSNDKNVHVAKKSQSRLSFLCVLLI